MLLCGIPASGKSTFGRYLRDVKGVRYLDLEQKWTDETLHRTWNRVFEGTDSARHLSAFLAAVEQDAGPVCLDWDFPVEQLWLVSALRTAGCRIVWFQCDERVARTRFQRRGRGSLDTFATQVLAIRANWPAILEEAQPLIVNVLNRDGRPKSVEALYAEVFAPDTAA
jgi:hypothetical protein